MDQLNTMNPSLPPLPTTKSGLRERNARVIKKAVESGDEYKKMREGIKAKHGFDIADQAKFPVMQEGFSWKKLREKTDGLREADSSSAFTQFLRAGIQTVVNSLYETTATTYEDWVTVVQSSKDTELYAPNHGVAFPRAVGPSQKYPEVGAAALDIQLKNHKFGAVYSLEMELLEDDQTGSFQRQAGLLGEYMKILTEVLVMGKLASVANMKYIDLEIPTSETKPASEASYPWSTGLVGGGATRPASFGVMTQANIQNGIIALMGQKNLQGIRMQVSPNRLLIGPKYAFDAHVLLHSAYYPSGAAAAGSVGGAFAINPLKSILDVSVSRYMFDNSGAINNSSAWYLVDDSKPFFVLQLREAISVVQENPLAGASFDLDHMRFKARSRMNADFIDPRFAWIGSDGSV